MAKPQIFDILKRLLKVEEKTEDTGWIDITLLHGEKQTSTSYYDPKYRKIGNLVVLKGVIFNVTKTVENLFQLPERI